MLHSILTDSIKQLFVRLQSQCSRCCHLSFKSFACMLLSIANNKLYHRLLLCQILLFHVMNVGGSRLFVRNFTITVYSGNSVCQKCRFTNILVYRYISFSHEFVFNFLFIICMCVLFIAAQTFRI